MSVQPTSAEFFNTEASAKVEAVFKAEAAKKGFPKGARCSILDAKTFEEKWFTELEGAMGMLKGIAKAKAKDFAKNPKAMSPDPGMCSLMCCYMMPYMCCCGGMAVQGVVDCPIEQDDNKYYLVVAGTPYGWADVEIAQVVAKAASVARMPTIKGGYKKFTDVPLLQQPSSADFMAKVEDLKTKLSSGDMESLKKVLNFAVFIFGMRHPNELRELINNLEAVQRAKDGAADGAVDPEEDVPNEKKFEALKAKIDSGDEIAMHKVAVAGISLISIFHIDQLPELFPINSSLDGSISKEQKDIRTVAMWAVTCFAKYHPDVVTMMKLVPE